MKKYFLIIITMAVAYAFSSYAGTSIFVNNTPNVNRGYLADLQNKFKKGVNNVYLAFSIFNQKPVVKKNIANNAPTMKPYVIARPTSIPTSGASNPIASVPTTALTKSPSVTPKIDLATIDPADIPANLFKSIAKGVSAYEGEDDQTIIKIKKGTTYTVRTLSLPGGKTVKIIESTSQ